MSKLASANVVQKLLLENVLTGKLLTTIYVQILEIKNFRTLKFQEKHMVVTQNALEVIYI